MALGRRGEREETLWVATASLPRSAGHPFYTRVNALLAEADFDRFAGAECAPAPDAENARAAVDSAGIYFRMLLVGYFEGIDSQRGIAWRCSDSLRCGISRPRRGRSGARASLSLTVTRQFPSAVHEAVFARILQLAATKGLLRGSNSVAVDATTLEANAVMKSIVRRDTGESRQQYIRRLAVDEGVVAPTEEDARRLDSGRRKKRVSNAAWQSSSDPASWITKLEDGRTHLAYKAEHVIDVESEVILAPQIYPGDARDVATLESSVRQAEAYVDQAAVPVVIEEVVADKGYHAAAMLAACEAWAPRTYIPERDCGRRRWHDKPVARGLGVSGGSAPRARATQSPPATAAFGTRRAGFAHICGSGNQRRTWLRGIENVQKRYLLTAAARNLGLVMRHLFRIGTPRSLQGLAATLRALADAIVTLLAALVRRVRQRWSRSDSALARRYSLPLSAVVV